jgi:hypothetical protein
MARLSAVRSGCGPSQLPFLTTSSTISLQSFSLYRSLFTNYGTFQSLLEEESNDLKVLQNTFNPLHLPSMSRLELVRTVEIFGIYLWRKKEVGFISPNIMIRFESTPRS